MSEQGQLTGPDQADSLVGSVYEGTEVLRPVRPFVVLKDPPGGHVWVENLDPPHNQRRMLRRRLFTYHYRFLGKRSPDDGEVRALLPPPMFDGPRFAAWLRRWMEAENIGVKELAARAQISASMVNGLRRGIPARLLSGYANAPQRMTPGINVIAAVAHALDLEFAYVAAKAGLSSHGDRWQNFTAAERTALALALDTDVAHLDEALDAIADTHHK